MMPNINVPNLIRVANHMKKYYKKKSIMNWGEGHSNLSRYVIPFCMKL